MEDKILNYPCTSCGACCRRIGQIVAHSKQLIREGEQPQIIIDFANFPHAFNEMGKCEHLQDDNTCAIYETRPDVCNIKRTRELYFPQQNIADYFSQNAMTCNILIGSEGLEEKYYIDIEKFEKENNL